MKKEPTIYVTYSYKYCALFDICRQILIQGNKFIYLSFRSCVFLSQDCQLTKVMNLQS